MLEQLLTSLSKITARSSALRLLGMLFSTVALAGCAGTNRVGSVAGGECRVFSAAPHVILGKTQPDQDWIDGEIEAGVGACGFPRPGPRPAALDAPATRQVPAAITPPRKRKGVIRRFRERVLRSKPVDSAPPLAPMRSQAPIVLSPPAPAAAPAAVSEAPRPVTPPPPPQDPVDALLHPRK